MGDPVTRAALFAFSLPCIVCSCNQKKPEEQPKGKPRVCVVNYPLEYFAARIGGDAVDVVFPVPRDEDPAYWMPDEDDVAIFQKADLILLNGAGYAKWVEKVSLPGSRMVDTSSKVKDRYIESKDAIVHQHGKGPKHSHAGTAFITWLDADIAIAQATAVRDALIKLVPERQDAFQKRFTTLVAELKETHEKIASAGKPLKGHPVMFSHPVYHYLERGLGIRGKSVHFEPAEAPRDDQWKRVEEILKSHPAKWMIWEGTPLPSTRDRLAKMGVRCVVFNPCGNVPKAGDFLAEMQANAKRLETALSAASPANR